MEPGAGWLSQSFQPPAKTEMVDDASFPKPAPKPLLAEIGPRMSGIRSDAELSTFLGQQKQQQQQQQQQGGAGKGGGKGGGGGAGVAVVEFGTAWCTKCHEMFPAFYALSKKYPQHSYAVAQLETLGPSATAGLRYTPTFRLYRGGRVVDEVVGKEPQRLEDHLWLHADDA
ncbi:thioredoxin-like [Raphidocelis subcapitata]|uniref:Thioredoxin-like n=1 Tax=Raphidocelis subcapitata TaxID=307507 RepID=A0A2V0PB68_9CHLO|nr:thioredoxin-like [Raphidocelis subcapitata]|eukprot:GBF96182.1 thioredoxin-like [Raphidocelis subcapitata]